MASFSPLLAQLTRDCGQHSNIPECCIDFFVETWWPLVLQSDAQSAKLIRARDARKKERERQLGVDFGHIPCDACLTAGNVVQVLPCPPHCPFAQPRFSR